MIIRSVLSWFFGLFILLGIGDATNRGFGSSFPILTESDRFVEMDRQDLLKPVELAVYEWNPINTEQKFERPVPIRFTFSCQNERLLFRSFNLGPRQYQPVFKGGTTTSGRQSGDDSLFRELKLNRSLPSLCGSVRSFFGFGNLRN